MTHRRCLHKKAHDGASELEMCCQWSCVLTWVETLLIRWSTSGLGVEWPRAAGAPAVAGGILNRSGDMLVLPAVHNNDNSSVSTSRPPSNKFLKGDAKNALVVIQHTHMECVYAGSRRKFVQYRTFVIVGCAPFAKFCPVLVALSGLIQAAVDGTQLPQRIAHTAHLDCALGR